MATASTPRRDKWIIALCWIQMSAAVAAAVLALWEVESILGTCPLMAVIGWLLTRLSVRKNSLGLVLFGLFGPLVTSLIALLIAIFQWYPKEAASPVQTLLTANAVIMTAWGGWVVLRIRRAETLACTAQPVEFQFSLLRLLGVMTVTCLLAALLRNVDGSNEWIVFASYGVAVLLVSAALWVWFEYRVKKFRRETGLGGEQRSG